ncbi:Gamma-aminobutyrate alpha-ketoglutarate aminotransferase [Caenispirillum salinarum AK4]|uniref:Gamma-aminobutyrate alpha-ketoglutarate aminotransferase n=1 Tax=Caenispirillum salinarum AK4 TaxID=1238182 RepID=K9H2Z9_9PROT|nr:aminotransferase [Caenispirillum salinarum]EKV31434.1 Gamma-aminobutyrate alpha-ketoglutarate aminotransferase [Caenispirillum salinarum AK4]
MTHSAVPNLDLEAIDRNSVIHPFTHLKDYASGKAPSRVVTCGSGITITDSKGNEIIDGFAGLYCVNVGYGREEIAKAIYDQASRLAYYHAYAGNTNEPTVLLSQRILEMAPNNMQRIYYGMSGSDANETQAKLVWYYNNVQGRPEKKKIIARQRGYHGGSVVSGSMTGLPVFHHAFDLPVSPIRHTTTPHYYWGAEAGESEEDFATRCAEDLERMILEEGPETVAAFIGEPVLGTGGIVPPPATYWEKIQAVLDKYDVLLIADEVVCGFGRTGMPFGSHLYGMKPDLITVAKGLTSAYQPLSGAIVGEKVWKVLEGASDTHGPFAHGYTYSAHPCGAAAALANLDIIEREDLTGNARDTGAYFQERMKAVFQDHPLVGEVRGVGLLGALEFVAHKGRKERLDANLKVGARMSAACMERKLIARAMPHGDILGFAPPLSITRDEVDEVVARAKGAVDAVTDELVRENVLTVA